MFVERITKLPSITSHVSHVAVSVDILSLYVMCVLKIIKFNQGYEKAFFLISVTSTPVKIHSYRLLFWRFCPLGLSFLFSYR